MPGQGSQVPGMGKRLTERFPAARAVFDDGADALGFDLREVMWCGSAEMLTNTENAQPAIVLFSIAALRAWETVVPHRNGAQWAAGHSVGAVAAAIAVGALTVADGVRLCRTRGELMGSAPGSGAMLAVAASSTRARDEVVELAQATGVEVACRNGELQIVLSGSSSAIDAARSVLGGRARVLDVSHGFHSALMDPVLGPWTDAVANVGFRDPESPMLSSITGERLKTAADVREDLRLGIRSTVRWDLAVRGTLPPGGGYARGVAVSGARRPPPDGRW
ncbi:ACP S-malonyltransferase [Microbacterium sp. NPDC090007]|uniref:ACP S-malonyltransferase n=1 Tax=Microbacterium sp. NPDC090007 TaxID=3364204 RepID=UPI0038061DC1